MMKIYHSPLFARKVKKITPAQKSSLDKEIKNIVQDPSIGVEKKGDLKGVFVHKFKIKTELYLLAYRISGENLELITLGSHENYYRDLKTYLKNS